MMDRHIQTKSPFSAHRPKAVLTAPLHDIITLHPPLVFRTVLRIYCSSGLPTGARSRPKVRARISRFRRRHAQLAGRFRCERRDPPWLVAVVIDITFFYIYLSNINILLFQCMICRRWCGATQGHLLRLKFLAPLFVVIETVLYTSPHPVVAAIGLSPGLKAFKNKVAVPQ